MSIALANDPTGATLGGTTSVTAVGGVATFTGLTLNLAASGYTLSAFSGNLALGGSTAFTVSPAAATKLVVTTEPPSERHGGHRVRHGRHRRG